MNKFARIASICFILFVLLQLSFLQLVKLEGKIVVIGFRLLVPHWHLQGLRAAHGRRGCYGLQHGGARRHAP